MCLDWMFLTRRDGGSDISLCMILPKKVMKENGLEERGKERAGRDGKTVTNIIIYTEICMD